MVLCYTQKHGLQGCYIYRRLWNDQVQQYTQSSTLISYKETIFELSITKWWNSKCNIFGTQVLLSYQIEFCHIYLTPAKWWKIPQQVHIYNLFCHSPKSSSFRISSYFYRGTPVFFNWCHNNVTNINTFLWNTKFTIEQKQVQSSLGIKKILYYKLVLIFICPNNENKSSAKGLCRVTLWYTTCHLN